MNPVSRFFSKLTMKPQGMTIVIAAFLPIFAIVSMFPIVASMIAHFQTDPDAAAKVPLMVTAPGLTIAILAPFAGWFVDKFGRRRLLLICTFFYGLFGTLPFFLDDLNHIFASRLALGVCESGILTIVNTLLGDYWDNESRRNWLFLQGVIGPFLASGVILMSGLVASMRWNGGFLVYLVAFPIYFAMLAFLYEPKGRAAHDETPAEPTGEKARFPVGAALGVAALTLFSAAQYYVFIVNGSIAFGEVGVTDPAAVAKISFLPSLFVILGALLFRILSGRSNGVQLGAFLAILGTGLAVIGLARNPGEMIVGLAIQQTGAGMAVPSLIAWAQTKFPFEHRGRGMGIWTGSFFFGQFISPVLVHQANGATGSMQGAFLSAGVLSLTVALAALGMGMTRRRTPLMA
ncbi:MAG: MFS transporter [Novosphingobium sp.]|uniref:MFS transporter n=1 Tax=Novosphingobium sp. TaxID=1874826 RepID=UPI0012C2196E|nr:MFS transporter [Novosphingobium sp.]MPS69591.1 MFS transporter [Novosphingobium sp.]